jgi:fatty acid omega-hydroxylase
MTALSKISDAKAVILPTLGVVVGLIVSEFIRRRRSRPRGAYFVPGHWLLGNLPEFVKAAAQKKQNELGLRLQQKYGRTLALKFPLRPWTVKTTCPKNVQHVLKTNFDNYPKGPAFQANLWELLGRGIFNADGHEWHMQRKVSSHMFTAALFKEHIWVVVRRNARKLRDILESSEPEKPVDLFNFMNRFTLDTIGEIGFGKCIGSLEDPSSPFLVSFDKAQQISYWRLQQPWWPILKFFRMGAEKETHEHFDRLDAYSRSVVRELCSAMNHGAGKGNGVGWADIEARKSFVGLFLEDARKRGETLSEDYLRDLVLNFLIAGRDTTAQALSWTIYCLSEHPEVEAAARHEIIDVCGVRGPAYDDMNHLPYLQAVISEALRLYPSVPVDIKVALDDDTWPDGTFVPKGANVVYDIYSMGRDCSIWGEDAEVFRPARWLEMKETRGNYEYPVFNAGPRECLGRRLAMVEMKTCLAMILPQMSFRLAVPRDQITTDAQLTIGMGQGLPCFVKLVRRQRAGSNVSTTLQSECESISSETAASSEAERMVDEVSEVDSHHESCSESSPDSASVSSQASARRRKTKRKSGWSRQRQSRFWQSVRGSTPERWPSV